MHGRTGKHSALTSIFIMLPPLVGSAEGPPALPTSGGGIIKTLVLEAALISG